MESSSESAPVPSPTPAESSQADPPWITVRLSVMMFLEYGSLGLWAATVGTYLASNTGVSGSGMFAPGFIGTASTAGALGAILSPALMGVVADRWLATQWVLAGLHLVCALSLWVMCEATTQVAFYLGVVFYFQAYAPTTTLTSSLALRKLPNADRLFPIVRGIGTGGWVAAGLIVGFSWRRIFGEDIEATLTPLWLGLGCHLLVSLYCLTLPHTPALGKTGVGLRALAGGSGLWQNKTFIVFIAISVLAAMPSQFYNAFINPFLNQSGYQDAAGKMTLGQMTEVATMCILPWLLLTFGLKRLFLIGIFAWTTRFVLLGFSDVPGLGWMAYPAILVHGACFTFVYLSGQLYADKLADRDARGAAQGMHMLATQGIGHLLGAWSTSWAQARYLTPENISPPPYEWRWFWLIPAAISLVAACLFAYFFSEQPDEPDPELAEHPEQLTEPVTAEASL